MRGLARNFAFGGRGDDFVFKSFLAAASPAERADAADALSSPASLSDALTFPVSGLSDALSWPTASTEASLGAGDVLTLPMNDPVSDRLSMPLAGLEDFWW